MKETMQFHHVCVIGTDYERSVRFYVEQLGMEIRRASFSVHRGAEKIELCYNGCYLIELFIYPPKKAERRADGRLQSGLDHVSFLVPDVEKRLRDLEAEGVAVSGPRVDSDTGKPYGFCFDPDGQKIEFYQM